ncbi:MAG TPA: hypothetical protein VNA69_00845 [Thermoanaerobaculia bacterium]|nr:hypothetical protein [Thermoanaerobaculia bacterium]
MRLDRLQSVLLVIDVQEKLMPVIDAHEDVARNIEGLVRGCHILGIPALLTVREPMNSGRFHAS